MDRNNNELFLANMKYKKAQKICSTKFYLFNKRVDYIHACE